MQARTVVSPLLEASCHVVADEAGRCLVVDPGAAVTDVYRIDDPIGSLGLLGAELRSNPFLR